jgi:enamine deaminase RidA (YjgF/YER057c/UK114 family)
MRASLDSCAAEVTAAGHGAGVERNRPYAAVRLRGYARTLTERRQISSGSPFEPQIGFSRAVRVGDLIQVSGTGPIWDDGSFDDDAAAQARRCLEIIVAALEELGASVDDVVRTRIYLTDPADVEAVGPVHAEFFGAIRPAATAVAVAALLDPRWKVEIEADAVLVG